MVDPASIAIGVAIGTATRKFVDTTLSLGGEWLAERFKGHLPKAKEKAQQNTVDFIEQLAQRVKTLEEQDEQNKTIIDESLSQPDFSTLLQKAVISSAQTEDKQKHEFLARLVTDRLSQSSESLFTLTSQLACDAISRLNISQIKLLGVLATIFFIRPIPFPPNDVPQQEVEDSWSKWLEEKLSIGQDINANIMDYLHLQSLSCIKWDPYLERELEELLNFPKDSGLKFDYKMFSETDLGIKISQLWKSGLGGALPTTIGILIGIYVSDMLLNTTTPLDEWGKSYPYTITDLS
ncbi:LPO_1073/Vpar_1526 family protein [Chloroflexota bacterium]